MSKILRDLCIFAFIFAQLSSAITEEKEKEVPIQSPIPYHAYAMFVIWSFLVELPLLAIRNAKSATLHLLLFALLDLSTLGSVAFVTYYSTYYINYVWFYFFHFRVGENNFPQF